VPGRRITDDCRCSHRERTGILSILWTSVIGVCAMAASAAVAQTPDWSRPASQPASSATQPERTAAFPPSAQPAAASRTPIRRGDAAAASDERAPSGSLPGTLITLAAILAGLYVALRLLKRMSPGAGRAPEGDLVKILGTRRIDAQSQIHVVRIGNRVLAIGASPAGLTTLSTFADAADVAVFLDEQRAAPATAPPRRPLFNGSRPVGRSTAAHDRQAVATPAAGGRNG
jgi:flagellar biogenesis protein FliO